MGYFTTFVNFIKRLVGLSQEVAANPQVRVVIKIVQDIAKLQSASNEDKREYAVQLAMKQLGVSESMARFLVEAAVQALKQQGAL